MVNYLSKFVPNLSEITSPLRSLLKKETEFLWDEPQSRAFERVKQTITQSPVLVYYDPNKELTLEVDPSKDGIGACLMRENRPIAFASKSLTQAEIGYAQIEKELLAILFGCKRFHQYTYGRRVTVHSDHKPISAIMRKPISAAPPRLSRMLLQLQRYSIDVIHKSGKDIPVSDFLSRSSLPDTFESLSAGLDLHVHAVFAAALCHRQKVGTVQQAILQDRQMQALQNMIVQGWPETRSACEQSVLEYGTTATNCRSRKV